MPLWHSIELWHNVSFHCHSSKKFLFWVKRACMWVSFPTCYPHGPHNPQSYQWMGKQFFSLKWCLSNQRFMQVCLSAIKMSAHSQTSQVVCLLASSTLFCCFIVQFTWFDTNHCRSRYVLLLVAHHLHFSLSFSRLFFLFQLYGATICGGRTLAASTELN